MTINDLGGPYNNYSHPTHDGDDISVDTGTLSGATVISDIDFNVTTDTLGHVIDATLTTLSTRNITPGDIGAATSGHNHDHGSLTGLSDDDHSHYFTGTDTRSGNILDSGDDLDTIVTPGFYSWTSSVPTNTPSSLQYAHMLVTVDYNQPFQMVWGGSSGNSSMFIRRRDSGTWHSWVSVITSNSITGNTNNNILTATGGSTLNGESNLTFDGTYFICHKKFHVL